MWQVIGQPRAVSLLQRSLEKGSLAHAYLFVGLPHVGKMTLAVNLAQALNCQVNEPPCLECSSCQKIDHGKHADVQIISLTGTSEKNENKSKTEIGIEKIRQIQHSASLPPCEGIYKVFIISEADYLSIEAANCLLKTLEEPFGRVLFILLAKDINSIPDTVISRCQKLELMPLSADEVENELINRRGIEAQKARVLSRLCRGCIGWAISASRDGELLEHYCEDRDKILDIIYNSYEERFGYAERLARQFNQKRETTMEVLNLWIDLWRDLLLAKTGLNEYIINTDIEEKLTQLAGGISIIDIRSFIKKIQEATQNLRRNVNPRLAIEVLMLYIPERRRERIGS
ncbi:MAG: DNA polymerase III subunit delta' C-terminal domain-containing protein [Chloroflexota bacterium]